MTPALPIVPRRLPGEATSSWLHRIGKVYEVDPHSILDEWLAGAIPDFTTSRTSIESRINPRTISIIAHRTRIPQSMADSLIAGPASWVTESSEELPVCPKCLLSDDRNGSTRYKRTEWSYSWRTTCSRHRSILIYSEEWSDQSQVAKGFGKVIKRPALAGSMRSASIPLKSTNHVKDHFAIASIREIETAIRRALAGHGPPRKLWGPIGAQDFLMVVQDVASFVLTNFSDQPLPPICTMDLEQFSRSGEIACFARRPRRREPWSEHSKVATLASIGDPGLRRCALFWVRDLMHMNSTRRWINVHLRTDRVRRQARTLERQCSEGLAWLAQRMERWPAKYRNNWWASTRILGLAGNNIA